MSLSPLHSKSNVVVTGVPTKAYRLPTEWIQPNTTVVNVASFKNVDEEALLKIEGVTYVPMVGKVTGEKKTGVNMHPHILRKSQTHSTHLIV